jgi:uncharacterized protein
MTPLLWAYPENKLERFKLLLEHGANPNVIIESDFGTRGAILPGTSVTHLSCETSFPGYFEAVFAHGGDPNIAKRTETLGNGETPLFCVIKGRADNKAEKIKALIRKGADVNRQDANGMTAAMTAAGWGGRYDIALILLEAGADPRIYQSNRIQKLIHIIARMDDRLQFAGAQQQSDYQKLIKWLKEHAESIDEAREDIKRWDSWSGDEVSRKMDAEIAARIAKEARNKPDAKKAGKEAK